MTRTRQKPKLGFWRGFARGLDLNIFPDPVQPMPRRRRYRSMSVASAIKSDWEAVGSDMRKALAKYDTDGNQD